MNCLKRTATPPIFRKTNGAADIRLFIQDKLEDGIAEDIILSKLMKIYSLTKKDAERHLKTFHK